MDTTNGQSQPPVARKGGNVLLIGPTGTGKTYSACTFALAGLNTCFLMIEPFMDVIERFEQANNLTPCNRADGPALHWHHIPIASPSWDALISNAQTINTYSFEQLSKLKSGLNKPEYSQFMKVLQALSNFKCDRCGRNMGAVDSWTDKSALILDSLSGLNIMAMDLVVGAKPVKAVGEWGVAMDNLERLINKLCADTSCWFTLIAHVEREVDEVVGTSKLMASTLGRRLAPRLPRFFHDVVYTKREGNEFAWSTTEPTVDTKTKLLPLAASIPPTFVPVVNAMKGASK